MPGSGTRLLHQYSVQLEITWLSVPRALTVQGSTNAPLPLALPGHLALSESLLSLLKPSRSSNEGNAMPLLAVLVFVAVFSPSLSPMLTS